MKSKFFNKFLELNKKIVKNYHTNKNIILVDRGRYGQVIQNAVAAAAVSNKYSLNVLVLSDKKKNIDLINFYKSFGFNNFYFGFRLSFVITKFFILLQTTFYFLYSLVKINRNKLYWFINSYKIKDIKLGDLIYDSYIRNEHRYLNPKIDFRFLKILFISIFKTLDLLKIIKKNETKLIIVGTENYAGNHGISLRIGLKKKIKVIEVGRLLNNNYHNYKIYDHSILKYSVNSIYYNKVKYIKFKKFINSDAKKINLKKFLKKRFSGKLALKHTAQVNLQAGNKSKSFINKSKFLKKLRLKENKVHKIILIASHLFSDAPHGDGLDMVFEGYFSQLKDTLNFIDENEIKNVLWLVRPHPLSKDYQEVGIVENLVKKINNKNIILCPKSISTQNLLEICDHVITTKGTIGLEFACYGKCPIIAGISSYSKLNIALEPKNKNKYFLLLKQIKKLPKLNKKQVLKARQALYFLEKTELWDKKLKKSEIFFNSHKNNINWGDNMFDLKLIKKLKIKRSFLHDNFYKDCLDKINLN